MANKNFTQFALSGTAESGDFLVGYKQDGSQELRFTAASILTAGNYDFIINGVNIGRGKSTNNLVFGESALNNISTGKDNIAIGNFALSSCTTSNSNIAIGANALLRNATSNSSSNIAIGRSALASLTGFGENIAIGYGALSGLRDDGYNIAIGDNTLKSAVGSNQSDPNRLVFRVVNNIGLGNEALIAVLSASSNVSLGNYSLQAMLSGTFNTAVGNNAGYLMGAGTYNSFLGGFAGDSTTGSLANCTLLGYQSRVTGNNQVQLGNSATTTYAYGAVQDRSDIRDKADVRDTALGLDFIMALHPVDFKWDLRDSYKTLPPAALSPEATEEAKENQDRKSVV